MRPFAADNPVSRCVCLSVTCLLCTQTAEQIGVLFGAETLEDSEHIVLDGGGGPDPLAFCWFFHW